MKSSKPIPGRYLGYREADLARAYAQALRRALPKRCRLWVGGQGFAFLQTVPVAGVKLLRDTAQAVKAWQKLTADQSVR